MTKRKQYNLHIISDSTGGLAGHMINAILTQFPHVRLHQNYYPFTDSQKKVDQVLRKIKHRKDMVFYALVDPDCKETVAQLCAQRGIANFDLTGSLVQFIADHTQVQPLRELSRLHQTNTGYFQRIEAMEFTAQHDDGRRLESLGEAEIVILGLSRVSKSPTSTFLGSLGYKVANVSLSPKTGFPKELKKVTKKIIAFTTIPKRLFDIRQRRFASFKSKIDAYHQRELDYYELQSIIKEVMWAEAEYRKCKYPILDITDMTVEEIAAKVLEIKKIKRKIFN